MNHISIIEYLLINATAQSIQSQYCSESKIYLGLEDEFFKENIYPDIIKSFNKILYNKDFKLDKSILIGDDSLVGLKLDLANNKGRKEFKISSSSNYNGMITTSIASGNLVNEIFESNNPYLFSTNIDLENDINFANVLEEIYNKIDLNIDFLPNSIYNLNIIDYEKSSLLMDGNKNFELLSYRDSMLYPYVNNFSNKEVFIIVKNKQVKPTLFIGGNEEVCTKVEINGLIYVEGDILITGDFAFQGIIIIKDGDLKIQEGVLADIKGLLISNSISLDNLNMDNIKVTYHKDSIYKYGVYLPSFIDPQIISIKTIY